ncbi:hypothetical protein HFP15_31045 [Amycolatopsis sp. K13G38]|uniref:Uncharacterized protein n=1 Tax=Amycolatopsis acididurans TaxID=2724524 RepID=A0ABX1JBZ2_9PSEU|nr:hypothetical protein [Amycolatopsis acididurans]NKQ57312.1 hypothetical protein [Amycolatopsis acididurans]
MPATVRLCPVDPSVDDEEKVVVAVRVITTAYSDPGDRVALADAGEPAPAPPRGAPERRDRLVESVLRLGRGASAEPALPTSKARRGDGGDDEPSTDAGFESGPGPALGRPPDTVADRTLRPSVDDAPRPRPDRFAVIILGCTDRPVDPGLLAEWAPLLTPAGTLIVLTHSNQQRGSRSTRSGALHRAAAMAGLALTDRLILAHQPPSSGPPTTRHGRRAIALGGHLPAHSTALAFRPTTPSGGR